MAEKSKGFTPEERAAMKERAKELKAEARKADGETALLAKIAEMPQFDQNVVAFRRLYLSAAVECELDKQGRILIPPRSNARIWKHGNAAGPGHHIADHQYLHRPLIVLALKLSGQNKMTSDE